LNTLRIEDIFSAEVKNEMGEFDIVISDRLQRSFQIQMAKNDYYKLLEAMEDAVEPKRIFKPIQKPEVVIMGPVNNDVEIRIGDMTLTGTYKEAEKMTDAICDGLWDEGTYTEALDEIIKLKVWIETLEEEIERLKGEDT